MPDHELTTAETADDPGGLARFRQQVRAFLDQSIHSGVACPAYGPIVPPALIEPAVSWQRHCAEHGFAGIHWPARYGGRGLSRAHSAVWYEECARSRISPYLNLQGMVLAAEAILRAGTGEQKETLLAPTLRGDVVWCQLFSEPGAGSDLAGLSTRAMADGDHFVINGQKVWSSNAELAHYGILLARTNLDAPPHRGISFFCYDMTLPGTEVRPLRQMTGDAEFSEVFFSDVSLPATALVGDLDGGWAVAMAVLTDERGSFGAAGAIALDQRLGQLAAGLGHRDPVSRDRFSALIARGRSLEALLSRAADDPAMASVAKVMRSELDFAATEAELDASGAAAMLADGETGERFCYSPGMRIAGGTSEIQRSIIGERVLGLPREPRPS